MDFFLNWFTQDETFPFFIQYGTHDEDLCLHTHADFSELVIVLSGTATHVVDGEEYPIRKGDVFVISNNTAHGYKHPKIFIYVISCSTCPIFWTIKVILKQRQAFMHFLSLNPP